ncbi:MAG: hypothetical protein POELPBGB_01630 [Bacteroidia bacterium]|nr:hypothetical protein [Bacteroidia bacterium]
MQNGTGLLGGISSTQAALIVPQPLSNTLYYLFTTDDFCNNLSNGLRYSVIDICEDNKNGDILQGFKNILLVDTIAEKITAVRHSNGEDYWVVVHRYFSNKFYSYKLTSQGLEAPIISSVGSIHQGGGSNNMWRAIGQMVISSDGSRLALGAINGANLLEVFDFNNSSGILSNSKSISTLTGSYGVAFSPDGLKLYSTPLLTQYNLNAGGGNQDSITASAYDYPNPDLECGNALQLGPNGKLYMYNCFDNDISVINAPDLLAASSNAVANVFTMQTNATVFGLPNMIAGFNYSSSGFCDTANGIQNLSNEQNIKISPNPFTHHTTLQITQSLTNATLTLHTTLGQKLREEKIQGTEFILQRNALAAGIYFLTVFENNHAIYKSKLIIE